MSSEYMTYESASCFLRKTKPDTYMLINVYSKELRKGHASGLLAKIAAWADEQGVTVWLEARQYGNAHGMPTDLLIPFYKKFGFKLVVQNVMVRESQKLHSL